VEAVINFYKGGMTMKRGLLIFVALFAAVSLLFLTSVTKAVAAPKVEKLRIGLLVMLSGAGAPWGINAQKGLSLACEEINENGGIKVGDKTYMLDFISADSKYTGSAAVAGASRLIYEHNIRYLISFGSTPCIAVSPLVTENKVLFAFISFTPRDIGPQFPYNFKALDVTSHEVCPILWKYAKEKYGIKTMVTIGQNDDTGVCETQDDMDTCKGLGIKTLSRELFDLGTTDFMPLVTKVVGMKPDAIDPACCATGYAAEILKGLHQLGYKGKIVVNTFAEPDLWMPITGKGPIEGVLSTTDDWTAPTSSPEMRDFRKKIITKYGEPFSQASAWVYWGALNLADAFKRAGSIDPDVIRLYWERPDTRLRHWLGEARFGGKAVYGVNHQIKRPIPLTVIKDGRNVRVQDPIMPPLELE
jgi:branched-chain amino acid transport system substrate-binding protein